MTFEELYRIHHATVFRAAVQAVGRRDVGEEIAAETFLELHRRFGRIDTDRLPGWLITVARNRAVDYWRRERRERRFVEETVRLTAPTWSAPNRLGNALFSHPSLKAVHRACLAMRYRDGMTRDEIAMRLGLSATQVRGHLQYGLILLRKHVTAA